MTQRKYYTLDEARELLPIVKEELIQLQNVQNEFREKYHALRMQKNKEQVFELECKLEFLQIEANLHIENIHSKGIQLKDIDYGLIDFPAWINGEEVLLCWRQGEPDIEYYHGIHDGFSGRKKIQPEDFF